MGFLRDTYINLNALLDKHAQHEQDVAPLIDDLARFCVEKMTANYLRVWLVDKEGKNLLLQAAGKGSRDNYVPLEDLSETLPVSANNRPGKVLLEGATYLTDDTLNDPLEDHKELVKEAGYLSYAAHLISWGGMRLGVMDGYSSDPLPEDIEVILGTFLHLLGAIVYQQRSIESFCDASGLPINLVRQMIRVGEISAS